MLCDASILVPLFVPEKASERVDAFLRKNMHSLISDFAIGEFSATISTKLRRADITLAQAERILTDFDLWISNNGTRVVTQADDLVIATRLVRRFDLALRMPDALYIALASRLSVSLATLDRHQAIAGRTIGIRVLEP
jgi:predicted nucleic acid-binding protein